MKKIIRDSDIVWKTLTKTMAYKHCPNCLIELSETGKDYAPYSCKCGRWFYNEEKDYYEIKLYDKRRNIRKPNS